METMIKGMIAGFVFLVFFIVGYNISKTNELIRDSSYQPDLAAMSDKLIELEQRIAFEQKKLDKLGRLKSPTSQEIEKFKQAKNDLLHWSLELEEEKKRRRIY